MPLLQGFYLIEFFLSLTRLDFDSFFFALTTQLKISRDETIKKAFGTQKTVSSSCFSTAAAASMPVSVVDGTENQQ